MPLRTTVAKINRALGAERRFDGGTFGVAGSLQVGTLGSLVTMVRGDDDGEREGNRILIHDLFIRFAVRDTATNVTNNAGITRFILFNNKDNNGATTITTTNLLINGGAAGNNWIAPFNPKYVHKKYKVYKDKLVPTHSVANTRAAVGVNTYDSPWKIMKFHLRWKKGLLVQFDGNAGTSADVQKNCLYYLVYSNVDDISDYDVSYRIIYTP